MVIFFYFSFILKIKKQLLDEEYKKTLNFFLPLMNHIYFDSLIKFNMSKRIYLNFKILWC
jgi:hypothetical protein